MRFFFKHPYLLHRFTGFGQSLVDLVSVLFSVWSFFPENCRYSLLQDCLVADFLEAVQALQITL